MYEKHTAPILQRRVAFVMRSMASNIESFMEMMSIDINMMVLNFSIPRKVYYKEKYCISTPRAIPTKLEDSALMIYHKGVNKYVRQTDKKKKKKTDKKVVAKKPAAKKGTRSLAQKVLIIP